MENKAKARIFFRSLLLKFIIFRKRMCLDDKYGKYIVFKLKSDGVLYDFVILQKGPVGREAF